MAQHPCPESEYSGSDSEFDFAFPEVAVPREIPKRSARDVFLDTLEDALRNGDVDVVKQSLDNEDFEFSVNETFPRSNWTCLMYASHAGSLACVEFLVERGADVTLECESLTPILMACDSSGDHDAVFGIVELLLARGASPSASDRYGLTPLMYACRKGQVAVAEKLVGLTDPETIDSTGRTALFHAVEDNRKEMVEKLLELGVCRDVVDFKGFSPKRLAEFCGHNEIADLIPRGRGTFDIPTNFLTYSRLEDVVPGLVGNSEVPAYFPDLRTILFGMNCDQLLPIFAVRKISLEQFLSLNEETLKSWGIKLPFLRKKLLHGVFLFHRREWSKKSVPKFRKDEKIDMLDVFRITASNLKHLVILKTSHNHIRNTMEMGFKPPAEQKVASCRYAVQQLIESVASLRDRVTYIQSFNPKPILHIDHEAVRKKRLGKERIKSLLYFTCFATVIGLLAIRRGLFTRLH